MIDIPINESRDLLEVDFVIVGAGPSGLSVATKLMNLAKQSDEELSAMVATNYPNM